MQLPDVSVIQAILDSSPLLIALIAFGWMGWLHQKADSQNQEANQILIENQRRLREDIERHAERKERESEEKRKALECRIEDLEQDKSTQANEINDLRRQVEGQEKEIASLNRTIQQRDKRISELADLIKQLTDANEASAVREKAKDKLIGDLQGELAKVQKSRAEAAKEREEAEATIEKLEKRLKAVENKTGTGPLGEAKKDAA